MKNLLIYIALISLTGCVNNKEDKAINCPYVDWDTFDKYYGLQSNLDVAINDLGNINLCAKELNKPILTIYGCWACVGDQKGVIHPLTNKKINNLLNEKFLIRHYYVDDKTLLPDSLIKNDVKTVGKYFSNKQANSYRSNSQPFYTITDWREKDLTNPISYVPRKKVNEFESFLLKGLEAFKMQK